MKFNFQISKSQTFQIFHIHGKAKNATGRRKEAVTRIFLTRGSGKIIINDKDYKQYFSLALFAEPGGSSFENDRIEFDKFDVKINATGGGIKGQAEAAKLGIARALLEVNAEFRPGTESCRSAATRSQGSRA